MAPLPTLEEIGERQSLLGPHFVGFMRWNVAAVAGLAALGTTAFVAAATEARFPTVRRYDVPIPARPGLQETTILHITDLHMFRGQTFIKRLLAKVAREEHFDMVASTGDNLGDADSVPLLLDALEPLLDRPGAFVLGSNDYYSPQRKIWGSYLLPGNARTHADQKASQVPDLPWLKAVEAMTDAGWVDLSNHAGTIRLPAADGRPEGQTVALLGVDDPHIKRDRPTPPNESWWHDSSLRLALVHSPYRRVLDNFAQLDADLVLAGHTHGGQIRLPGVGAIVTNSDIPRRHARGLTRWQAGTTAATSLHVSAGLGTSRYAPVRLFCRPEISLLRVCPV